MPSPSCLIGPAAVLLLALSGLPVAAALSSLTHAGTAVAAHEAEISPAMVTLKGALRSDRAEVTRQRLEHVDVSTQPPPNYVCAQELRSNSTCSCDGYVKFGRGSSWSSWMNVAGSIECQSGIFGDPAPGSEKECVCQPKVFDCASEWGRPWANCLDKECHLGRVCRCDGQVRFGYGERWTTWRVVTGKIRCSSELFGDPYLGQGKLCQCQASQAWLDDALVAGAPAKAGRGASYAPVGLIMSSIVAVIICYFVVYLALAVARSLSQISSAYAQGALERALSACTSSVYLAPMLCAAFFTITKRAETLTAGKPHTYGYPPRYLGVTSAVCAVAFVCQVIFHMCEEWTVAQQEVDTATRNVNGNGNGSSMLTLDQQMVQRRAERLRRWTLLKWTAVAIMYLAIVIILIGTALMKQPQPLVKAFGAVTIAPGTVCTLGLAVTYFAVYLVLRCLKTRDLNRSFNHGGAATYSSFGAEVMNLAPNTLSPAPMLAALFMGSQITADWSGVALSGVLEVCTYMCTFAVLVQVILVLLTPFMSDAELEATGTNNEVNFVTTNRNAFILISLVRWAAMTAMNVGVLIFCARLWRSQSSPSLTHLLARLATIYFVSYLVLWVAYTGRVLMGGGLLKIIRIMTGLKDTLVFCPMLAILALCSFVRARHFTNDSGRPGVPQGFVQDYMYVGFIALVFQLLTTLASGIVVRSQVSSTVKHENDSHAPEKGRNDLLIFIFAMNYIATAVLYFSVCVVCVGLFIITPQTATGNGGSFV